MRFNTRLLISTTKISVLMVYHHNFTVVDTSDKSFLEWKSLIGEYMVDLSTKCHASNDALDYADFCGVCASGVPLQPHRLLHLYCLLPLQDEVA